VSTRHHQCKPGDGCFHRFQGRQNSVPGFAAAGRNKGVMAQLRDIQRAEAGDRNAQTPPEARRSGRCPEWCGHKSHARPSRRGRQERPS
jgi:hypothetical protein